LKVGPKISPKVYKEKNAPKGLGKKSQKIFADFVNPGGREGGGGRGGRPCFSGSFLKFQKKKKTGIRIGRDPHFMETKEMHRLQSRNWAWGKMK